MDLGESMELVDLGELEEYGQSRSNMGRLLTWVGRYTTNDASWYVKGISPFQEL